METRLSWLVFGAGAIGTYIGGSLILHGQNVAFLEQSASVTEINQRGLCLNLASQEHRILHPEIFSTLPDAISHSSYDIAIFALKSYDTQSVLESMRPYADYLPPVLCLQNGIDNEAALAQVMGKQKVIAGTVTSSVLRRAAGDIQLERQRGVGIASGHSLLPQIFQALSQAGLNPQQFSSASAMKWSKMLTNLLANASSAILDMPPTEILADLNLYTIEMKQLREALSACHASNIQIVNLPGTPVRLFAWMVGKLPTRLSRLFLARIAGTGRGGKMPSFHIDLHSGRGKTEVDYLNGAVVRHCNQLNLPSPVNMWLNTTLEKLAQGILPLETYSRNPDKYCSDLRSFINGNKSGY